MNARDITEKNLASSEAIWRPLSQSVTEAIEAYLDSLDGHLPRNLYELVLDHIEPPLLEAVAKKTRFHQTKMAIYLGLSRSTLIKKLRKHDLVR